MKEYTSHHTSIPRYTAPGPVVEDSGEEERYVFAYPPDIRRKIRFVSGAAMVFFLWGYFFIPDEGWLLLGILVMGFMVAYYRFRIRREVTVGESGVSQVRGNRVWRWRWNELREVSERFMPHAPGGENAMRRMTFIHKSGHDISIDTWMGDYDAASKLAFRMAGREKVPFNRTEVGMFFLPYW